MFEKTVFPNGTRIVTEYIPHVRSVSLGVWFEVGARNEKPQHQGYSHFIEHLAFKGSDKYSAKDIAELMDSSGGYLNAFTGKEHTCYYAKVLDEHFPLVTDILMEMLMNPMFAEGDIEKERGVILEEIKLNEDTPDELVHDLLCESLWPNHSLGRSILGSEQTISEANREILIKFMKEQYSASRLVISVVGNVQHEQVVEQFGYLLENLSRTQFIDPSVPHIQLGDKLLKDKDIEQVHLCLGGLGLARYDYRKYTLYLLDTIIGGGMSSRLFQELREERGLVYSTYSYHSSYRDTGNFAVYAGCSQNHLTEVIGIIEEQLDSLANKPIVPEELERAKGLLKGNLVLALENTTNRMTRLAKNEINYSQIHSLDEIMSFIERVTVDDVYRLAAELYQKRNLNIAAIGPSLSEVLSLA